MLTVADSSEMLTHNDRVIGGINSYFVLDPLIESIHPRDSAVAVTLKLALVCVAVRDVSVIEGVAGSCECCEETALPWLLDLKADDTRDVTSVETESDASGSNRPTIALK